jgi:hypothetical protein
MAKRKAKPAARAARPARKASVKRRSATRKTAAKSSAKRAGASRSGSSGRPTVKKRATPRRKTAGRSAAPKASARKTAKPRSATAQPAPTRRARLDRARRTLDDVQTPPSSLDMDRHGSAARTGRAEMEEKRRDHPGMGGVSGGDPDVDIDQAYFSGEEAPGGDTPTPDQDVVDDIGKALGVEYEDNEELKASDKVVERDRHRWELDPASSEDYKERK